MATTTNYGWTTPDDTDLVKDGAAAIRTLGSSVDTTTKALNPSTTLGDIEYRSATANTNTRLGIGTTGQVLTVSGGVPTWATASSGGMTLISTTTLSGTAVSISSIPSGYNSIQLWIQDATYSLARDTLFVNPNGATNITTAAMYRGGSTSVESKTNDSYYPIGDGGYTSGTNFCMVEIFNYASASTRKSITSAGGDTSVGGGAAGFINTGSAITSLTIRTFNSRNFTGGTALLYGVK